MRNIFKFSLLFLFWVSFSGQLCTKKMVYGKDYDTSPWSARFSEGHAAIIEAAEESLKRYGYEVLTKDETAGKLVTGWKPVEVDSHFVTLFDRRDYGVSDGAYYQMTVNLIGEGSRVKVLVGTVVKSIVGPMESSGRVEKRVLNQMQDYLRSPQIEMTNVGVEKK